MKSNVRKSLNPFWLIGILMLLLTLLPGCEPTTTLPPAEEEKGIVEVSSMKELGEYFDSIDYNFSDNPDILNAIPRFRFTHIPKNWDEVRSIPLKKSVFFRTMATMALEVNEDILEQRNKLLNLGTNNLSTNEQKWLANMMKQYKVSQKDGPHTPNQIAELHIRVDIIPPSLTLVQAAIESAWGSSRFAREGNALFGQWTTSSKGIKAHGSDARLATFSSPRESVAAYCLNLNTHPSYSIFRVARGKMRKEGRPLDGVELAMHLEKYSEKGVEYTSLVKSMIVRHGLEIADNAKLADGPETVIKPVSRPVTPS